MSNTLQIKRQEELDKLIGTAPTNGYGGLRGYSSQSVRWTVEGRAAEYRFGVEIEKEDMDSRTLITYYQDRDGSLDLPHKFVAERDGSLNRNGYELISPVYDLYSDKYVEDLSDPVLAFLLHGEKSHRCGGHMTLSYEKGDRAFYTRVRDLILPILYALYPKRAKLRGFSKFTTTSDYDYDRNVAIRVGSEAMEIRIFSAVKNITQLKWRVKLLRILVDIVREEFSTIKATPDIVYKKLIDTTSPLGKHVLDLYGLSKYTEKIMLTQAFTVAYTNGVLSRKLYSKLGTKIPNGVRAKFSVAPAPPTHPLNQLPLHVHNNYQEEEREA